MPHTPGPWTMSLARFRESDPIFGFSVTAESKIPFVASAGVSQPDHHLIVDKEYRKFVTTGFTEEEVEANGRLIASAPDLLAVLDDMVESFATIGDSPDPANDIRRFIDRVVYPALVKAKGIEIAETKGAASEVGQCQEHSAT